MYRKIAQFRLSPFSLNNREVVPATHTLQRALKHVAGGGCCQKFIAVVAGEGNVMELPGLLKNASIPKA